MIEKEAALKERQASVARVRESQRVGQVKIAKFAIDLQSIHAASRIESLEQYYKVAQEDKGAVEQLESIEAEVL